MECLLLCTLYLADAPVNTLSCKAVLASQHEKLQKVRSGSRRIMAYAASKRNQPVDQCSVGRRVAHIHASHLQPGYVAAAGGKEQTQADHRAYVEGGSLCKQLLMQCRAKLMRHHAGLALQMHQAEEKLRELRSGSKLVTGEERAAVERAFLAAADAWAKRKRMFKGIWCAAALSGHVLPL